MDALVRTTPKDWAAPTVEILSVTGAWDINGGTVALATPPPGCMWLVAWGCDATAYMYNFGVNQNDTSAAQVVAQRHYSSVGTSGLCLLRPVRGKTWPGAFHLNVGSNSWQWVSAALLRPMNGFVGVSSVLGRNNVSGSSVSLTTPTNRLTKPGGIYAAVAHFDSGGSGITTTPTGYVSAGIYGLGALAVYILPTDRIITPPNAGWAAGRSDAWALTGVYLS